MKSSYKGYYIDSLGKKKLLYSSKTHISSILEFLGMDCEIPENADFYIYEFLTNLDIKFLLFHIEEDSILGSISFFKEAYYDTALENVSEIEKYDNSKIYMMLSQDRKEKITLDELKNKGKGR